MRLVGFEHPGAFHIPGRSMTPQFYYAADSVNGHDIAKNFSSGDFLLPEYIRTYKAPFTVSSNSFGCRDRSFDPQDGYVLLIGDSVTHGYVALEETWGAILEQLLDVRVLKCGVSGYGARHERHKLDDVTAHAGRPRFVIVGHVWNDILDDYLYPGRTVIDGYMLDKVMPADAMSGGRLVRSDEFLQRLLKNRLEPKFGPLGYTQQLLANYSILYDRLENSELLQRVGSWLGFKVSSNRRSELEAFQPIGEFPWLGQAWEEHLENLRQLKAAVAALDATMIVVIFPDRRQLYDSLRPQKGSFQWEYPNQRLTEFLQQDQIAFVDLLPEFRQYVNCSGRSMPRTPDDLYWAYDDHPNVKGNRLAGLLIGRHVLEGSFVQVRDKTRRLSDIDQLLSVEAKCSSKRSQN
ncbi:MAG: GDSL-type esterase/lipase family protein [Nitrospira sp.]|nr:GDSL-type esterase/lipase family protein [Nitrospira sp.]